MSISFYCNCVTFFWSDNLQALPCTQSFHWFLPMHGFSCFDELWFTSLPFWSICTFIFLSLCMFWFRTMRVGEVQVVQVQHPLSYSVFPLFLARWPLLGGEGGNKSCWRATTWHRDMPGGNLQTLPADLMKLPMLEKLYLDNNKIALLPPEVGRLTHLQVLQCDHNSLVSVPGMWTHSRLISYPFDDCACSSWWFVHSGFVYWKGFFDAAELHQCVELVELSLEHNKLVRPLLDFR